MKIKKKKWNDYKNNNREKIIMNKKKILERNRRKTDVNFRLIDKTRRRIHNALKGNVTKSSSTKEILRYRYRFI